MSPIRRWAAGLAAAAVVLVFVGTLKGAKFEADACQFASLAENLVAGGGFRTSMTLWSDPGDTAAVSSAPPLYPALLAAVHALGPSVDAAARIVAALSFALLVGVTTLLAAEVRRGPGALLAGGLCLLWTPILQMSFWAGTDVPFAAALTLVLYACLRAERATGAAARRWIAVAVAACIAATLLRYMGVAVWVVLLWWGLRRPADRGARQPGRVAVLVPIFLALAPLVLWFVRNHLVVGNVLYGERETATLWDALRINGRIVSTLASDPLAYPLYGHAFRERLPFVWEHLAAAIVCGTFLVQQMLAYRRRDTPRRVRASPAARWLIASATCYLVLLLCAVVAVNGRLEARYVAPAYPALLAAFCPLLWPPRSGFGRGVMGLWLVWVAGSALLCAAFAFHRPAFLSLDFRDRASTAWLRASDAPRYLSDNTLAAWFVTRRPAKRLPPGDDPEALRRLVEQDTDAFVLVYRGANHWSPDAATLEDLLAAGLETTWEEAASFPDCVVFRRR